MTRSLPSHPDLEHDRKQAKRLKRSHDAGDAEALARIREHHPRFRSEALEAIAAAPFRLADAQLVVAREYGVESWARLSALVAFLRSDFEARARLFVDASVGEHPERARDLLRHAPELAQATLATACAAAEQDSALRALEREVDALHAAEPSPLWILCWSNVDAGDPTRERARVSIAKRLLAAGARADCTAQRSSSWGVHRFGALYGAVHTNRPELVAQLLEHGADANDGESLYHATEHKDGACLLLLLAHGARIEGTNALHRALDQDDPRPVEILLEAGADPGGSLQGANGEWTPLHNAALRRRDADTVARLVAAGAPLEARDAQGQTAYQIARRRGARDASEQLLALGADPTLSAADRFVAACASADEATARGMLARNEVALEALAPRDLGTLAEAAHAGHTEAVDLMLALGFPLEAQGGDWPGTALNHAAHQGRAQLVARLLERGADPELENAFGGTALGALAWSSIHPDTGATDRSEAARQRDLAATVDVLLGAGVEVQPAHLENASPAVAEALRRNGVTE